MGTLQVVGEGGGGGEGGREGENINGYLSIHGWLAGRINSKVVAEWR